MLIWILAFVIIMSVVIAEIVHEEEQEHRPVRGVLNDRRAEMPDTRILIH